MHYTRFLSTDPERSFFGQETITVPAHGLQVVACFRRFHDFSQAPDMYVNGALFQVFTGAPDVIQQLRPAVSTAEGLRRTFEAERTLLQERQTTTR